MLPSKFKNRMQIMLGKEYSAFEKELQMEAVRGLRVNTLKCSMQDFLKENTLPLEKIPYSDIGFILNSEDPVGRLAEHHSGRIYMQDPGAMAPICAVDIPKGARIADLCAAPGGKSSHAAALIGDDGFILSNEIVPKRAKILVSNLERLGVKNALVTSMDTAELASMYNSYFDIVITDAPCSGEGMFRKNDLSVSEWSEENVLQCAKRQEIILNNAARLVCNGGILIYSTCTYATEENEERIRCFLSSHPDFHLIPAKQAVADATCDAIDLPHARRFYPHISKGEGQFLAILKRDNSAVLPLIKYKDSKKPLNKQEAEIVDVFFKQNFTKTPDATVAKVGENIVLIPHGMPPIPARSVFMSGVLVGELQKDRLIPSHQLFSSYGHFFKTKCELSGRESDLLAYLEGEEITAPIGAENGWCVITYKGSALGGGKISSGRIKNHYPKGLRNRKI